MNASTQRGKQLRALQTSTTRFIGIATVSELRHFGFASPLSLDRQTVKQTADDDRPLKALRTLIQRTWDKTRILRAESYGKYMGRLRAGAIFGATPPLTLYSPTPAELVIGADGTPYMQLPFEALVMVIDGETQFQGRLNLAGFDPDSIGDSLDFVFHAGISEEAAMQILHDTNRLARPISEAVLGPKNHTGGLSQTIHEALLIAGKGLSDLNPKGGATKHHIAGFQHSMCFAAAFEVEDNALARSVKGYFPVLNEPGSPPIDGGCPAQLAELFKLCVKDEEVGRTNPLVWQVAGVLAAKGHQATNLDWAAGQAAYKATGRKDGLPGLPPVERIAKIKEALA
jgi:hypothetical protein